MKIAYQGIPGSYSESCAKKMYPDCETISCKTFDECFEKAKNDSSVKAIIPESNKTTGNIGVEYLIFKYRLNIFAEHFFPISHNLLGLPVLSLIHQNLGHINQWSLPSSSLYAIGCSSFIKKMKSLPVPATAVFCAGMGGASVFGVVSQGSTFTH